MSIINQPCTCDACEAKLEEEPMPLEEELPDLTEIDDSNY